jgi:hypothetical protein
MLLSYSLCFSQKCETIFANLKDTTSNYFLAFTPSGKAKGLLLLLPGFGETALSASKETIIDSMAFNHGLITVFASLQHGNISFYVDSLSQSSLDMLIPKLQKRFNMKHKPFYIGGFSLGGSGAIRYTERACASTDLIKPNAVFAIDPPLDFIRFYNSCENTAHLSKNEIARSEADYFIRRCFYEFKSAPQQDMERYINHSPFCQSDTARRNVRYLAKVPIRIFSEPEINWQLKNRNRSLYDLNVLDCSAMINTLVLMGNEEASLTVTTEKGYRKATGNRNPHSWSIADGSDIVEWLLQH